MASMPTHVDLINIYELAASGEKVEGVEEKNVYSDKPSSLFRNSPTYVNSMMAFIAYGPVLFDCHSKRKVGGKSNLVWELDGDQDVVEDDGAIIGVYNNFMLKVSGRENGWRMREYKSIDPKYTLSQSALYFVFFDTTASSSPINDKGKERASSDDTNNSRSNIKDNWKSRQSYSKKGFSLNKSLNKENDLNTLLKKTVNPGEGSRRGFEDFESDFGENSFADDDSSDEEWAPIEEPDFEAVTMASPIRRVYPRRASPAAGNTNPYNTRSQSKSKKAAPLKASAAKVCGPKKNVSFVGKTKNKHPKNVVETINLESDDENKGGEAGAGEENSKMIEKLRKENAALKLRAGNKGGGAGAGDGEYSKMIEQLRKENAELKLRAGNKESDLVGSLLKDLMNTREKNSMLERRIQEAESKIKALDEQEEKLIETFNEERDRRSNTENALRKEWQDSKAEVECLKKKLQKAEESIEKMKTIEKIKKEQGNVETD